MELRQLEYLLAVARHGHFTRAAEELHVAQPAVSQQLRRLEREVGLELIDRSSRSLTAAGDILAQRASRALHELEAARSELQQLSGLQRGVVRLGAIHWLAPFDLAAALGGFTSEHVGIDIGLREEDAERMLDMLQDGQLDLVMHNVSPATVRDGIDQRIMFSEELVVMASVSSDLAGRTSISLAEVAERRVVAFRRGAAFREIADQAFTNLGLSPRIALESSDLVTIRSLVAEGLGVALMPRSLAETPGRGITQLAVEPGRLERSVALAWRNDHSLSPAAQALLTHFHQWLDDRHQLAV